MGFWKDLERLDKEAEQILLSAANNAATRDFVTSVVDSLLSLLDDYTLEELKDIDLDQQVSDILKSHGHYLTKELADELTEKIQLAISSSLKFYQKRGVETGGVQDEIKRSKEAAVLSQSVSQSLANSSSELRRGTVETLQRAVLAGEVNRSDLRATLTNLAGITKTAADVESQAIVGAYNQLSRNVIRNKAGLKHGLYYGHLQRNSRGFCRIHIMKVYTLDQIRAMDNGMLNPVIVHRGGYRCIHTWVWVDPEWDDDLKEVSGGKIRKVYTDKKKKRFVKVYANDAQAERLVRQYELNRQGFVMIRDAVDNDSGFTAVHMSWYQAWTHSKKQVRKTFKDEFNTGELMAELGYESLFTRNVQNLKGGPVDMIMNGVPVEIKIPQSFNPRRFEKIFLRGITQSETVLIHQTQEMMDVAWGKAVYKIRQHLVAKPETQALILQSFDKLTLIDLRKYNG